MQPVDTNDSLAYLVQQEVINWVTLKEQRFWNNPWIKYRILYPLKEKIHWRFLGH